MRLFLERVGVDDVGVLTVDQRINDLLGGNIEKVMISATLWLPYLILSERVNLTYRSRIAAM